LRGEALLAVPRSRRPWVWALASAALGTLLIGLVLGYFLAIAEEPVGSPAPGTQGGGPPVQTKKEPTPPVIVVKIGVLINLRGPSVRIDQAILDGVKLAVEELNERGEHLEIVWENTRIQSVAIADQAKRFIEEDKVAVLIGSADPNDRQSIQDLLEVHHQLLLVPARCGNLPPGKRVLSLEPPLAELARKTAQWIGADTRKSRVWWIDDATPTEMELGRQLATALADVPRRPTLAYKHFAPKGIDWDKVSAEVANPAVRPTVIVASLHGDDTFHVFETVKAEPTPALLFVDLTEDDKAEFQDHRDLKDLYVLSTWPGLDKTAGSPFAKLIKRNPEMEIRASCNTASAYAAVHLWHQAAKAAGKVEPDQVRQALADRRFDGLGEPVSINGLSGHATRPISLGRMDATGKVVRWE
jgi:ABC-type branched-subunit amino acid transport system substrate-binding protein